jgi:hypothetical protein
MQFENFFDILVEMHEILQQREYALIRIKKSGNDSRRYWEALSEIAVVT